MIKTFRFGKLSLGASKVVKRGGWCWSCQDSWNHICDDCGFCNGCCTC